MAVIKQDLEMVQGLISRKKSLLDSAGRIMDKVMESHPELSGMAIEASNRAVSYVEYTERLVNHLCEERQIQSALEGQYDDFNRQLVYIRSYWAGHAMFEEKEEWANKWLVNALIMVIIKGFTFDGLKFKKGSEIYVSRNIVN